MKKLFLFAAVLMVSLFSISNAKAQVNVSINIGSQPLWGPTGYNHVEYYYIPDINAYYYVPSGQYIYQEGNRWVWVNNLPSRYNNFDLYNAYKVVINKPQPYLQNNIYVAKYSSYKNYGGRQAVIRDSRDAKYYVVKNHPNYNDNKPVIIHDNRPNRIQKTIVKVNQNSRPVQNNGRGNDNRGGNNRPERNGGQRVNTYH